jgi:hypothetical protein
MKRIVGLLLLILLLAVTSVAVAQEGASAEDACPAIIQTALQTVSEVCQGVGRNQACYGNLLMQIEPQPGVENLQFEQIGDVADVSDIQSLSLSGMDTATGAWGVALLRIQANLPGSLPGQNVTFLLFGEVELTSAVQPASEMTLQAAVSGATDLRLFPQEDGAVMRILPADEMLRVDGRLEDNRWLRVQTADGQQGWALAEQIDTGDAGIDSLPVLDPGQPSYGPMQAFYFSAGIADAACEEAPDSGILIQTPEGPSTVTLNVNGIDVELGSTMYLRARPENQLGVSLIEGEAFVEAEGERQFIPTGSWITVPVGEDGFVIGPPSLPLPYNDDRMQTLPVDLLDRAIEIADSLTQEEIDALLLEMEEAVSELESLEDLESLEALEAIDLPLGIDAPDDDEEEDEDDENDEDDD